MVKEILVQEQNRAGIPGPAAALLGSKTALLDRDQAVPGGLAWVWIQMSKVLATACLRGLSAR